jgi:methylase of polypeptide subunit release factors
VTIGEAPRTREVAFGPLTIRYDDRVLRPRAWTVQQSSWAAELLPGLPPGDVLELCCGAGQIGLLATSGSDRNLVLVDADPEACAYARENTDRAAAEGLAPRGRVEVRHGLLEAALDAGERFALVLADPPWVPTDQVADHPGDPTAAIDGGADGLFVARDCLDVIDRHLLPEGAAIVQVGDEAQVAAVAAYLSKTGRNLHPAEDRVSEPGALVLLRRR